MSILNYLLSYFLQLFKILTSYLSFAVDTNYVATFSEQENLKRNQQFHNNYLNDDQFSAPTLTQDNSSIITDSDIHEILQKAKEPPCQSIGKELSYDLKSCFESLCYF